MVKAQRLGVLWGLMPFAEKFIKGHSIHKAAIMIKGSSIVDSVGVELGNTQVDGRFDWTAPCRFSNQRPADAGG